MTGPMFRIFHAVLIPYALILSALLWRRPPVRRKRRFERPGSARANYQHGPDAGNYLWPVVISRADVADFMLKELRDDMYLGIAVGAG